MKVVEVGEGREIAWGGGATEKLQGRIGDVQQAVSEGVKAVSSSLHSLATVEGWQIDEVEASFGVSLVAEAGAVLTKVSGEATFEVNVVFRRTGTE